MKPGEFPTKVVDRKAYDSAVGHLRSASVRLPTLAELGATKVGHKIDGISFAPKLFGLPRNTRKSRSFAFSESKGGKAWVRTQRYKLYNNGNFFDVRNDAMEKKPLKKVAGQTAEERAALQAALTKLNYPNKKK